MTMSDKSFLTVHNVRHGFATNSSSTHSIVYMRGQKLRDVAAQGGFGWGNFTLTDRADKRRYLAAQVYQSLCHTVGSDVALTVAEAWTGAALTPDKDMGIEEYVDHQSVISFPSNFEGKGICREYVEDFARFLDRDDVAVLGGNDNSDGHPDLERGDVESAGVRDGITDVYGAFVARKDPTGFWTLFNRSNGNKLRVSFGNGGFMEAPTKATAPELVDVSITNWCNTGCDYCYRNSTTKGRHADKSTCGSRRQAGCTSRRQPAAGFESEGLDRTRPRHNHHKQPPRNTKVPADGSGQMPPTSNPCKPSNKAGGLDPPPRFLTVMIGENARRIG